ncbi:MAG TPA: DNA methyltransferase [Acidobacteriaceae bacterium]|nr:DNA methyltransferase [Acidobacteriaceae bacterium]
MSRTTHESRNLFQEAAEGAVECLGLMFPSEDARRARFLKLLAEKLKDPEFRKIEGFPKASDEDILRLSDPPYFTACPNPFLQDFVRCYGKPYDSNVRYEKKPFAVDVSEGKTDPIYTAHSYHTKVPHKAIMRAILHYTEPGDLILDGFAGSGMTGVAAQLCGAPDPEFKRQVEEEWKAAGEEPPQWGARRAILGDLSPAATFIAANYNTPFDVAAFEAEARRILDELKSEIGWMYETLHTDGKKKGFINYTVWSDVFACANCSGEVVFLEQALDKKTDRVRDEFPCPHCRASLTKSRMERLYDTYPDAASGKPVHRLRRVPVQINYSIGKAKHEKKPSANDIETLRHISQLPLLATVPTLEIPYMHMTHERASMERYGVTCIHHFYLPRAAQAMGRLWEKALAVRDPRTRNMVLFFVEQAMWTMSILNSYRPTGFSQVSQYMKGIFYVPSQHAEVSPWYILDGKLKRLGATFKRQFAASGRTLVTTGDAALIPLPENSIDYIFTDPPFGENIYYADLNFLVESWHRVFTNSGPEAIVDRAKKKELLDYQALMQKCLKKYYDVLKPGRWMTMVFHNSSNAVWAAIQEALTGAGFVVADVRTLDKQQGSYRQVTSTAVKQDLVISAYKPNGGLEKRFELEKGTEEGVWDFVRTHLRQLPAFVSKDGSVEVIAERQPYLLFDRMVAFHVQRNVTVPLSVGEFFAGLSQRFPERDGMYFLPEQVAEYDRKRMKASEVRQLEIFVRDEKSAIQWLRQQLLEKPQTFQEIHPQFMREIAGWEKHEKPIELRNLLEENFLRYDGVGEVPSQIHRYLSTNFHDLRKLPKDAPALRAKARDRYYVPDPTKEADVQKTREKALLREFQEYRTSTQKRLKVFRLEAIRTGFRWAWQQNDYAAILAVAEKIPEDILQEDPMLLMWYTNSLIRTGRGA